MCGTFCHSPKGIIGMLLRISFCLSLIFVGLAHYMQIDAFKGMVATGLGPVAPLGMLWAYVMPGLLIVGGFLMLIGQYVDIGVWAAGIGVASIPAGMLLKSVVGGVSLAETMPAAINAFIWLLVFVWVVKCGLCCGSSCSTGSCAGGMCGCGNGKKK